MTNRRLRSDGERSGGSAPAWVIGCALVLSLVFFCGCNRAEGLTDDWERHRLDALQLAETYPAFADELNRQVEDVGIRIQSAQLLEERVDRVEAVAAAIAEIQGGVVGQLRQVDEAIYELRLIMREAGMQVRSRQAMQAVQASTKTAQTVLSEVENLLSKRQSPLRPTQQRLEEALQELQKAHASMANLVELLKNRRQR